MTFETIAMIVSFVFAFVLFSLIDSWQTRKAWKHYTAEYRRFSETLDNIKENMDQIAGPLLTSKVLFPDKDFYYPEETED